MELPRDIIKQILQKTDMDTRISLNLYTKLSIPPIIHERLTKMLEQKQQRFVYIPVRKDKWFMVINNPPLPIQRWYDKQTAFYTEYELPTGKQNTYDVYTGEMYRGLL